ncbi:hypothetical protein LAZ67_2002751 [Cordylochernes scorpioides]|uniref:Transposase Tc1-like domain-containing protein n=1 Tax=Cordylochernes scorpioides TaxID=51811 RepID=A0ABY6K5Q5_9ARAC|nr:hypothetical protein LAZ67_2002751 [Cordylochernes scorpioides]
MTDRCVRFDQPQCTTSRADRKIVRMAVTDRSVTSRTVAQHIQSVTHHPVSARNIRRRFQQSGLSARRPLLRLPLTRNHRRLHRQWCDERRMWTAEWNEIVFTDEARFYLQHHDGWIRVWRHSGERMLNSCVMHRHTGPAPGIMIWGSIGYHSRTPLVRIAAVTPDQLWKRVETAQSAVRQKHIQIFFELMPRRVAVVISNNGVDRKFEQRIRIIFCYKIGKSASKTLDLLKLAFGNENVNKPTTFRWFSRFKNGMESVKDEKRVGRPILHRNPEKVSQISNLIKENPRIGLRDIEEETGISKSLVGSIIKEELQLKKTPSKYVPKMLTIQQKENRVEVAKKMLEMLEKKP